MISNQAVRQAVQLAKEFDARNMKLVASAGTPLAEMVTVSGLNQCDLIQPVGEYTPNEQYIVDASSNFNALQRGEMPIHNEKLDSFVDSIAPMVQSHLRFARNKVKPLITELAGRVNTAVAAQTVNLEEGYEVVVSELPAPLYDTGLRGDIAKMANVDLDTTDRAPGLLDPATTPEQILDMLKFNVKAMDQAIALWLATRGPAFINETWREAFSTARQRSLNELLSGPNKVDASLFVLLVATKLHDTPPPEGVKMTLAAYNSALLWMKQQASIRLNFAIQEWDSAEESKLLIQSCVGRRITVYGHVYANWITAGGANSLLIANVQLDRPKRFVNDIDAAAAELLRLWERHSAMVRLAHDNRRFVTVKSILRQQTFAVVRDHMGEVFAHLPAYENNQSLKEDPSQWQVIQVPELQEIAARVDAYLETLREADMRNLFHTCMELIGNCVFWYTDSYKILRGIDIACQLNPEMDVGEAALLSLIEYVADFVIDQMALQPIQ